MLRLFTGIALIACLGSCADIMEPEDKDLFLPAGLVFANANSAEDLADFAESTMPPTIRVHPGRVVVFGRTTIPCPAYTPEGALVVVADTIDLRVATHPPVGAGCPAVLSAILYRGIIDVAPGTYHLRIRHLDEELGQLYALDSALLVP